MRLLILPLLILLPGCSTLHKYGIGGPPRLLCDPTAGHAYIDDRLAGPDGARASLVRRFADVDAACVPKVLIIQEQRPMAQPLPGA